MASRLEELKTRRAAAEAKLDSIIALDTGFDSSLDGESITAATKRYQDLIAWLQVEIDKEVSKQPWQRRVQTRAT